MEPVGDAALQPGPAPDDLNAWKAPTYENGLGAPSGESSLWGAPAPTPEQNVVVETYQPPAALVSHGLLFPSNVSDRYCNIDKCSLRYSFENG